MDALTDTEDVASVGRVPEGGGVTKVGLRGEEEFEGDVGGRGRVGEESVRLVVRCNGGTNVLGEFL